MMKPRVKDSDLQMCRICSGTGTLKETSNHRVFDTECQECRGEGWTSPLNKLKLEDVEAEDVEAVSGREEVELQREVLGWVKMKYKNDEKKFAAFLRFTMAYGRSQCDAREFHEFLRDAFGMDGALHIAPKLARLIKEKLYRVNLLKHNAAVTEMNKRKKEANAEKKKKSYTSAATDELIKQVGIENNLTAMSVKDATQTAAAPPVPPPIQ